MKSNNKNNQSKQKNHSILSSSLFQLCSAQSTGTVFIMTSRNTSAQIVLQDSSIVAFSFENKHGIDAIADFKQAIFTKSRFMDNYQFPLTSDADISSSDSALRKLGFNEYLLDRTTIERNKYDFKCMRPNFFEDNIPDYAM